MADTLIQNDIDAPAWKGGDVPYKASYGKLMMWFFLITDTLTFSAFLTGYGFSRFKFQDIWPVPEDVFTHFPFLHGDHPLLFVALMTFILIMSSVTMVLAVNYGHKMQKKKVILWLSLTIIGGFMFLSSQAWEWGHFIHGDSGAVQLKNTEVIHVYKDNNRHSIYEMMDVDSHHADHHHTDHHHADHHHVDSHDAEHHPFELNDFQEKFRSNPELTVRLANRTFLNHQESVIYLKKNAKQLLLGANLKNNEYGHALFADYFFFITGFHGFHVFSGVVLLIILLVNTIKGTYEKRGHYEMVEKIGLYWHFVDLVWVFVFTFFYLV